jgi:hypothetical protein
MRTSRNSQFPGKLKRPLHRLRIAGVATAGDTRRRNVTHQLKIRPARKRSSGFADVRIEINRVLVHELVYRAHPSPLVLKNVFQRFLLFPQ